MSTAGPLRRLNLYINGSWVAPALRGTMESINPATEGPAVQFGCGTAADVDAAVRAARGAFPAWAALAGAERARYLRAIASAVRSRKDELARFESTDCGKPFAEAQWDMGDVAGCFEYYADLAAGFDARRERAVDVGNSDYACVVRSEPVGVVAAITPWNYPLLMSTWKVAPALAAGCTVVLKPSELAPLTSLELAAIAHDVGLPAGVLNVVTGTGPEAGAPLVTHAGVDKVAFTGSEATGARIGAAASAMIKRVTLELGGKSPAVVFADADLERAAEWVAFGVFWTNGQICSATSRLLVQEQVADEFLRRLKAQAEAIKVGDPHAPDTKLGPVVSRGQYEKVLAHIEQAKSDGSTLLTGGGRPAGLDRGFFVAPTIFTDVPADSKLWREEVFGPVLAVRTFRSTDEAIEQANDTEYGLGAAVFSRDEATVRRFSREVRAGVVWANCSQPTFTQLPWGGFKRSGVGRELGEEGFMAYMESKQITTYVSESPLGWYPRV